MKVTIHFSDEKPPILILHVRQFMMNSDKSIEGISTVIYSSYNKGYEETEYRDFPFKYLASEIDSFFVSE